METREDGRLYLKIGGAPWFLNSLCLSLKLQRNLRAQQLLIVHVCFGLSPLLAALA